jgi:hypothetical protein
LENGTFSDDEEDMEYAELWHHEGRDQDY